MDPTSGGGVTGVLRFLYHTPELGPKFLRRFLSEMDLTATRDLRQFVDWLAVGRFAIAGLTDPGRSGVDDAKAQGLPVNWFDSKALKEPAPLSSSNGNVAFMNRAPHPNAAKVVLNWMLSREGQILYQKVFGDRDSLRIDIPKNTVAAHVRRQKNANYHIIDNPETRDITPIMKVVREVWKRRR